MKSCSPQASHCLIIFNRRLEAPGDGGIDYGASTNTECKGGRNGDHSGEVGMSGRNLHVEWAWIRGSQRADGSGLNDDSPKECEHDVIWKKVFAR